MKTETPLLQHHKVETYTPQEIAHAIYYGDPRLKQAADNEFVERICRHYSRQEIDLFLEELKTIKTNDVIGFVTKHLTRCQDKEG